MRPASSILAVLLWLSCSSKESTPDPDPEPAPPRFAATPVSHPLAPMIGETSGIADSKAQPGHLWAHEDSGNPTELHLLTHDGKRVRKVFLEGVQNRDWEDMARLDGQLFLADFGDNGRSRTECTIYVLDEPAAGVDTVRTTRAIRFRYPDGAHDAEALVADPVSKDLFLITKSDKPARIFRLPHPYNYSATVTAEEAGSLSFDGAVGAAISENGSELIVKTYTALFYFARRSGETVPQALQRPFTRLDYQVEPQGEAVAFARDNSGFFTLSEKGFLSSVSLNFYKRQ